jgi:hypothetical protein
MYNGHMPITILKLEAIVKETKKLCQDLNAAGE